MTNEEGSWRVTIEDANEQMTFQGKELHLLLAWTLKRCARVDDYETAAKTIAEVVKARGYEEPADGRPSAAPFISAAVEYLADLNQWRRDLADKERNP